MKIQWTFFILSSMMIIGWVSHQHFYPPYKNKPAQFLRSYPFPTIPWVCMSVCLITVCLITQVDYERSLPYRKVCGCYGGYLLFGGLFGLGWFFFVRSLMLNFRLNSKLVWISEDLNFFNFLGCALTFYSISHYSFPVDKFSFRS